MAFSNPIVANNILLIPAIQSTNFVEATTGWRISADGNLEAQNAVFNGTVAAQTVNAGILQQGGLSLDDIEAPFAQGLEGWNFDQNGIQTWAAAGEKILETTAVLRPNRIYLCGFFGAALGGTVNNDTHVLFMTHEVSVDRFTAPAAPTIASTKVTSAYQRYNSLGTFATYGNIWGWISNLGVDEIQATVALCIQRIAGAGQPQSFMQDAFGSRINIFDGGLQQANVGTVYNPGGGGGGTLPTLHDDTWFATDQQGYNENHTIRNDANGNAYAYQGYFSSQHGDHGGMFFFNSAAIRAALAGATITSSYIWLQNVHWYNNAGGTAKVGIHNTDGPPPANCPADLGGGGFVEHNLWGLFTPKGGSNWTGDLGVGLGERLRDGTIRGLFIGHAGNHNLGDYGFFTNAAIRIVYTK